MAIRYEKQIRPVSHYIATLDTMTHTTKKLLASLGVAALALTACSAEDMEAYKAEQEAGNAQEAADVELVEVPDLIGVNLAEAEDQLKELDLDADEYDVSEDDKSVWSPKNWEVVEQDPAAGEKVEPDTEVLLGVEAIEKETEDDDEEADEENVLAEDLEAALLESNVVDSFRELQPTSPGYYISEIEAVTDTTARIYIQTELSDDESEQTARWIFNHGCTQVDVETVVIQDTTGTDTNYYADRMNPPVLCE